MSGKINIRDYLDLEAGCSSDKRPKKARKIGGKQAVATGKRKTNVPTLVSKLGKPGKPVVPPKKGKKTYEHFHMGAIFLFPMAPMETQRLLRLHLPI